MRFLCLHGLGTNSRIFETQTGQQSLEVITRLEFDFVVSSGLETRAGRNALVSFR